MEQEREEAESRGVASPIHPDKPSTDRSYHRSLGHLLESVRDGDACVLIGSHNQDTIQFALERSLHMHTQYMHIHTHAHTYAHICKHTHTHTHTHTHCIQSPIIIN